MRLRRRIEWIAMYLGYAALVGALLILLASYTVFPMMKNHAECGKITLCETQG